MWDWLGCVLPHTHGEEEGGVGLFFTKPHGVFFANNGAAYDGRMGIPSK